jgi:hypothetical protein
MARDIDIFSAFINIFSAGCEKLREVHQDIKKRYCELEKAIGD